MASTVKNIVILTGAGVSAESGVPTFRDLKGLWNQYRIEDVASPEGFARMPSLVHAFYNMRRQQLKTVQPNAAHMAIAQFAAKWPGQLLVVTQNVDDLHERAASGLTLHSNYELIHMHGELRKIRCVRSARVFDWDEDLSEATVCSCCQLPGQLRPHIVWFGEIPLELDRIGQALAECDLFVAIGTSGNVYPAAGFVEEVARHKRAHTVELNVEPSQVQSKFDECIYGRATEVVPRYLEQILAQQ